MVKNGSYSCIEVSGGTPLYYVYIAESIYTFRLMYKMLVVTLDFFWGLASFLWLNLRQILLKDYSIESNLILNKFPSF